MSKKTFRIQEFLRLIMTRFLIARIFAIQYLPFAYALSMSYVDSNCTHPRIEGLLVLVVGMPKSGTTSIGEFLRCVSHNTCKCDATVSTHRHCAFHPSYSCGVCAYNNMQAGRPPLEHCGNFSAFTQLMCHEIVLTHTTHASSLK